ncbi:hypothetical protein PTKIN_Ptkin13bG0134700 [Pterospermum kingtungense]
MKMRSLAKLKILNMDWMDLRRIPQNLISRFSKLQILRMCQRRFGDNPKEDHALKEGYENLIKELKCLQHLNVLNITVKSAFALEKILSYFQGCTEELVLLDFEESKVLNVLSLANLDCLEALTFYGCRRMEEMKMEKIESTLFPINATCFLTLSRVVIGHCDKLRDTIWLILAPNLRNLQVGLCRNMEEILSERKLGEVANVVGVPYQNPFPMLQELILIGLPQLKSLYWDALPFPCLTSIHVRGCSKLKKLPFNSDSAKGNQLSIRGDIIWWENLQWEDDATRDAFLPSFKPYDW